MAVMPSAAAVSLPRNSARIVCVVHLLRLSAPPGRSLSKGAGPLLVGRVLESGKPREFTLAFNEAVCSLTDGEVLERFLLSAVLSLKKLVAPLP